jgi:hypothetical protein
VIKEFISSVVSSSSPVVAHIDDHLRLTWSLTSGSLKLVERKLFGLETCIDSHYLMLNFYQINMNGKIRTRDRLVIKTLTPCQRINLTQKFKLLNEILRYNLYYFISTKVKK